MFFLFVHVRTARAATPPKSHRNWQEHYASRRFGTMILWSTSAGTLSNSPGLRDCSWWMLAARLMNATAEMKQAGDRTETARAMAVRGTSTGGTRRGDIPSGSVIPLTRKSLFLTRKSKMLTRKSLFPTFAGPFLRQD